MPCPYARRANAVGAQVTAPPVASHPTAGTGALPATNASALRKVGDESMFVNAAGEPDFPSGLMMMAKKIPRDVGLGYYTSYRQDGDGNTLEKRVVLCTRPEFIEKIMAENTEHYLWGGIEPASVAFFGARVLFVLEGEEWSALRQTMRPVLLPGNLPMVASDVAGASRLMRDKVMALAEKGEVIDVQLLHQCYHLSAVSEALYSTSLPALDHFPGKHVVHESFNLMLEELARRAFAADRQLQFDYTSKTEDNEIWNSNRDIVHDSVMTNLRDRIRGTTKSVKGGAAGDMLQQLVDAHKEDHPDMTPEKTEEYLAANLVELLFAGYNTVVNTMSTAVWLLSQNPDKLAVLRQEVDKIMKGKEVPTFADIEEMDYLSAVMDETLRLYSPTPAIGRKLEQDTQLGAVLVPKGQEIMMPMCAVHRDSQYWDEPTAFRPERFAEPVTRGSWMPFSDGPRRCLGQHYARVVFKLAMVQHIMHFDYSPAQHSRFSTAFNGFGSMVYDDHTSKASLRMVVRKRQT